MADTEQADRSATIDGRATDPAAPAAPSPESEHLHVGGHAPAEFAFSSGSAGKGAALIPAGPRSPRQLGRLLSGSARAIRGTARKEMRAKRRLAKPALAVINGAALDDLVPRVRTAIIRATVSKAARSRLTDLALRYGTACFPPALLLIHQLTVRLAGPIPLPWPSHVTWPETLPAAALAAVLAAPMAAEGPLLRVARWFRACPETQERIRGSIAGAGLADLLLAPVAAYSAACLLLHYGRLGTVALSDEARTGLGHVMLMAEVIMAGALALAPVLPINYFARKFSIEQHPDDFVLDRLVQLIARIETYPNAWPRTSYRRNLVAGIDEVACLLARAVPYGAAPPDRAHARNVAAEAAAEIAAAFAELRQWAVTPKADTRLRLRDVLVEYVARIAAGDWDGLRRVPLASVPAPSWWQRLQRLASVALVAVAPLACLWLVTVRAPKAPVPEILWLCGALWGVVTVLATVDPNFAIKVAAFKDVAAVLPGFGKDKK